MDVGLYFFPTEEGPDITEVARIAEEHEFESLFVPEHSHIPATDTAFLDPSGQQLPERYRRIYDPFVALTAAAVVTRRLRIGTAACIVTQRDVILTAKAVATLDRISEGRLVFGVGAGWNSAELRTHGVEPASRFLLFTETLSALSQIWSEDTPSFHGALIDFDPIWSWPKPLQSPRPPMLVAGNSLASMQRAIDLGDGWLPTHRGNHDLAARVGELRRRADAAGRVPPTVTFIAADSGEVELRACLDAGVDRVLLPVPTGELDLVITNVERSVDVRERVLG